MKVCALGVLVLVVWTYLTVLYAFNFLYTYFTQLCKYILQPQGTVCHGCTVMHWPFSVSGIKSGLVIRPRSQTTTLVQYYLYSIGPMLWSDPWSYDKTNLRSVPVLVLAL